MERYRGKTGDDIIRDDDGDIVLYADAQATVEALQAQLVQEQALNTVRRDAWWQSVKELEAALDAERENVANLDAMYRQQLGDKDKRIDALAGSAKIWMDKLTQLQALVRALPVVRIDLNGAYHDTLLARPEDEAVKELLRYLASLDATTPATTKT